MLEQLDSTSESSASTVHLAIQGLHNTFYHFRRQQLRVWRTLVIILVLLCVFNLLHFAFWIYIFFQLRPVLSHHDRSKGG